MTGMPEYIFCGDDFTGASDTLATLARSGLRCRLFLDADTLLNCSELNELDAVGIATATRSMPPAEIEKNLLSVGKILSRADGGIFHYKVCSTFDSSPEVGSIGAAIRTLQQFQPEARVVISGGQPSLGRYCIFSNLFAVAADGGVYRIDRHPTMAQHPVTPMHEADIIKLLGEQGLSDLQGIHRPSYRAGGEAVCNLVETLWAKNVPVLFDVEEQQDLSIIGDILRKNRGKPILAVGSSSIAEAYLSQSGTGGKQPTASMGRIPSRPSKPVFVLAGSRSPVTAAQVESSREFLSVPINPEEIAADRDTVFQKYLSCMLELLGGGKDVLAVVGSAMNHDLKRSDIARFTAQLTARVASSGLIDRLCIAGGDTSSLALQEIGAESLSYEADVEPGICLCRLHSQTQPAIDGLEILLKGGQMGSPQLFNTLKGSL